MFRTHFYNQLNNLSPGIINEKLEISGGLLTKHDFEIIEKKLKTLRLLKLGLIGQNLTDENLPILSLIILNKDLQLKELDLSAAVFNTETALQALADAIAKNVDLQKLSLKHCGLTDENVSIILSLIQTSSLVEIELEGNKISPENMARIEKALSKKIILPQRIFNEKEWEFVDSPNNHDQALYEAATFLQIDIDRFVRIHTKELKKEFLMYRWLKKEYDIIAEYSDLETTNKQALLKQAQIKIELLQRAKSNYQYILDHPVVTKHQDRFSPASYSLQALNIRSPYEHDVESKNNTIIYGKAKSAGVEPGFLGSIIQDVMLELFRQIPDDIARWQKMESHQEIFDLLEDTELPTYILKLVYEELANEAISKDTKVLPADEDLKRSTTLSKLYEKNELLGEVALFLYKVFKSASIVQKNTEAFLEGIGNDAARQFGLTVQEQQLVRSQYKNGIVQFLLMAKWIKGANILGPLYGNEGKTNGNYRALPISIPENGIKYIADVNSEHFAEYLPLFSMQGDPDAIGKRGQNKLCINNELVGIDFGHAYEQNIIDDIDTDFHIKNAAFSNYSIFYDVPRSVIVKGLIRLAKLNGRKIDPVVLQSFGADFFDKIEKTPVGSSGVIFDDAIKELQDMIEEHSENTEADIENRKHHAQVINNLKSKKLVALKTENDYLHKFEQYLSLEAKATDLLENIEKLFAGKENTSLRSEDGTVVLNHIRVVNRNIKIWETSVKNDIYKFSAEFTTNEATNKAISMLEHIKGMHVSVEKNKISLYFPKHKLEDIYQALHEDILKAMFHPQDAITAKKHYNATLNTSNSLFNQASQAGNNQSVLQSKIDVNPKI